MKRDQFKTPEEDVTAEFDRVCRLFRLALGEPSDRVLFDALMAEASAQGMNWVQGLEYVVKQRQEKVKGDFPSERNMKMGAQAQVRWGEELRQAG